ncbi:MAG: 23S rRNA (adenine(2503)-C(2))-methyltransferase RlmN [Candidatus Omnitrophica bacterium]|nr:23S rRNA (adenine(2503)-C(2))-methyltransferase RlmN [Candidatus Omnitrophota bacterium]MCM8828402.1 23S rRNA (adenine(2503)-C(2))-methyltransferase RlmN [Candidatus Omnitrophota bacterium]
MKKNIRDLDQAELGELVSFSGEPTYRAIQIFNWLYARGVEEFSKMSDVPEKLREVLASEYTAEFPEVFDVKISRDGTKKYVFRLFDNRFIETVVIPENQRTTICISTQVGCKFGCLFCASGKMGFIRNLKVSEILGQVLYIMFREQIKITNIVFMGMGEPFDNYDSVIKAVRIITDKNGIAIGSRKIIVSTSGVVPRIIDFAKIGWQVRLSISLHSAINETRSMLMPINRKFPLPRLFDACRFYRNETKRRITFEYILLNGINDDGKHALSLAEVANSLSADVNIIPFSSIKKCSFNPPSSKKIKWFLDNLIRKGVRVTIRRSRGADIEAACGQLAGLVR